MDVILFKSKGVLLQLEYFVFACLLSDVIGKLNLQ